MMERTWPHTSVCRVVFLKLSFPYFAQPSEFYNIANLCCLLVLSSAIFYTSPLQLIDTFCKSEIKPHNLIVLQDIFFFTPEGVLSFL